MPATTCILHPRLNLKKAQAVLLFEYLLKALVQFDSSAEWVGDESNSQAAREHSVGCVELNTLSLKVLAKAFQIRDLKPDVVECPSLCRCGLLVLFRKPKIRPVERALGHGSGG